MKSDRVVFSVISFLFAVIPMGFVLADGPVVSAFSASPPSVNSGTPTLFTWNIPGGGYGQDILFNCPVGVTVKKADGSDLPCNIRQKIGIITENGSASFVFQNFSGSSQSVTVRLIPLDSSGAESDAGGLNTSVYVGYLQNPITDFSVSSSTVIAGAPFTLAWTGQYVPGVNLQFDCVPGLRITSSSPAVGGALPCGTQAYASDQPVSGSVTVTAVSDYNSTTTFQVRVNPAIASGMYDGVHGVTIPVVVAPRPAAALPTVTSFSASAQQIVSGGAVTLTWTSQNTSGVNLQFQCNDSVALVGTQVGDTASSTLQCSTPAYIQSLPPSGSTVVTINNTAVTQRFVPISLFPKKEDGSYDGTRSQGVSIVVLQKGAVIAPAPIVTPAPAPAPAPAPTLGMAAFATGGRVMGSANLNVRQTSARSGALLGIEPLGGIGTIMAGPVSTDGYIWWKVRFDSGKEGWVVELYLVKAGSVQTPVLPSGTQQPAGTIPAARTITFSLPLSLGSRGAAVTALQKFLAQDPALYPEGNVSGFFGALTEKALQRFQERYGLAKKGDAGYGFLGPKTRAKMNSMQYF